MQIREEAEGEKTRCRGERSRCHLQQRSTNLRLSCSANKTPTDDRCDSPLLDPNQPLATVCVCVCDLPFSAEGSFKQQICTDMIHDDLSLGGGGTRDTHTHTLTNT